MNEHYYDARNIAYQVAAYYGYRHQIIWACHTDGNKADYYRFQNHISNVLAPYGTYVTVCKDRE